MIVNYKKIFFLILSKNNNFSNFLNFPKITNKFTLIYKKIINYILIYNYIIQFFKKLFNNISSFMKFILKKKMRLHNNYKINSIINEKYTRNNRNNKHSDEML